MSIQFKLCLLLVGTVVACASPGEIYDEEGTAASRQAATVPATAATVSGACPRLEEVGMEFADYANFKEAGGWSSFSTAGNARKAWPAREYFGCGEFTYPTSGSHKNRVICYYHTDRGPDLGAEKTFPSNYACTCNDDTGRYTCIRQ